MLFCLASGADWERGGVTYATAQQLLVRGLIEAYAAGSRRARRVAHRDLG
jgi:hypothetical protein